MSYDRGFLGTLVHDISTYLFALPFGVFGVFHFLKVRQMAGMVPGYIPGPGTFWVYLTGAAMVVACICFIANVFPFWAGVMLGVMLLLFAVMVHLPSVLNPTGNVPRSLAQAHLLKDIALAGAAFGMAARTDF